MTNKLVVVINSLKVPKIKKILLYEIKFLVPNYSCLQIRGLPLPDPRSVCPLSSTEFVDPPPEKNSWVRHCCQKFVRIFSQRSRSAHVLFCVPFWLISVPKCQERFTVERKALPELRVPLFWTCRMPKSCKCQLCRHLCSI